MKRLLFSISLGLLTCILMDIRGPCRPCGTAQGQDSGRELASSPGMGLCGLD